MNETVVTAKGIVKSYGRLVAVDEVDLDIPAGCVFALMGRNGAGKSSLIRMLLGLTLITKGAATVFGLDCARKQVEIRRRVGYVPETHHMYPWMTIREIARFCSGFYPTWNARLCQQLVERFGLDPDKKISELSRGMVAKVALVLALAHEPRLLVLDEPTSGLDAVVRKEFLGSIVDVAAQQGRTVLISSHILDDVERVADRVALMDQGRIRLVDDLEKLKSRMREIKITFCDGLPDRLEMPGAVSIKKERLEWLVIVENFGPTTILELRDKLPGATLEPRDLSLEEIFIALVRPGGEKGMSSTMGQQKGGRDADNPHL